MDLLDFLRATGRKHDEVGRRRNILPAEFFELVAEISHAFVVVFEHTAEIRRVLDCSCSCDLREHVWLEGEFDFVNVIDEVFVSHAVSDTKPSHCISF